MNMIMTLRGGYYQYQLPLPQYYYGSSGGSRSVFVNVTVSYFFSLYFTQFTDLS